jgi:hypothetical protein
VTVVNRYKNTFTVSQQLVVQSTKRLNKNKQNRQCTYNVILRRSRNHYSRGRTRFMKYSDCVSVVVIQPAMRMCHIILSSVACPSLPYVYTLFHKGTIFRKEVSGHQICVLIFSTTFVETFLLLIRIERDIITNIHTF